MPKNRKSVLVALVAASSTCVAAEPPGIREALAKWDTARNEQQHKLYGSPLEAIDPAAYEFEYALTDLNEDGIQDAVVLLTGRNDCGSGGCAMQVLKGTASGFVYQSGSTISRAPIRVLAERRGGWKSL